MSGSNDLIVLPSDTEPPATRNANPSQRGLDDLHRDQVEIMNIESRLKKLESQYTPPMQLISVALRVELTYREGFEGVAHSEPTEMDIQRHIDNGGAAFRQGGLMVLVKKYCS